MKLITKLMAALLAALSLSACVGGAIVPVPIADARPTTSYYYPSTTYYYSDRYYPDAVWTETYRYP
jgi:hypothetical protein